MCPSKNMENYNLVVHLSSNVAQVSRSEKEFLVIFNTASAKPVTFHYQRADPEISHILMVRPSLTEALCFVGTQGLPQTTSWTHISDLILRISEKWLILPAILYKKHIRIKIAYSVVTCLTSKDSTRSCVLINYLPNYSHFEIHETSRDSLYTIVILMMIYIS